MNGFTRSISDLWRVSAAAAFLLLLSLAAACAPTAAPPGGCWDGALSEDPLRCYMLEQAVSEGRMDIEGIYRAPDGQLQIFLSRTETLEGDTELTAYLLEQAYEFLDTPAGHDEYPVRDDCRSYEGKVLKDCRLFFLDFEDGKLHEYADPQRVILHVGGAEARRAVPGWASWTQEWPPVSPGVSGSGGGFDVSDVDIVNIPEPDCDQFRSFQGYVCDTWTNDPGSRIAGYERDDEWTHYVQVKAPSTLPTDRTELDALKRRVAPGHHYDEYADMVLVPVKYDFGDMWRWYVILNRFARSEGNTIGIEGVGIVNNTSRSNRVYLAPHKPAERDQWGKVDASTVRWAVGVSAHDVQKVVDALPELLPLLGIPVDAVGRITQRMALR